LELAFEYLIRKDQMEWITIYSDQVLTVEPQLCSVHLL